MCVCEAVKATCFQAVISAVYTTRNHTAWTLRHEAIFDDLGTVLLCVWRTGTASKSISSPTNAHSPSSPHLSLHLFLLLQRQWKSVSRRRRRVCWAPPQVLAPPPRMHHSCLLEPRRCSPFILESQKKVAIY